MSNTSTAPESPKLSRCTVCNGRGYHRCDCWPGDCICGRDDEPCEECAGTGWIDPYGDYYCGEEVA